MLVSPNNEMAAMLARSNPPGIESYYYANVFFCFRWKTWMLITWVKPKNKFHLEGKFHLESDIEAITKFSKLWVIKAMWIHLEQNDWRDTVRQPSNPCFQDSVIDYVRKTDKESVPISGDRVRAEFANINMLRSFIPSKGNHWTQTRAETYGRSSPIWQVSFGRATNWFSARPLFVRALSITRMYLRWFMFLFFCCPPVI